MTESEIAALSADLSGNARVFGGRRRRRAAARLAELDTAEAARLLAEAFVAAVDGDVVSIAERALAQLTDPAAIDAVCDVMIATGDPNLIELVAAAGYEHSQPPCRALMRFLNGQFDENDALDFDGTLLAEAHPRAHVSLQARLAVQARTSGRVAWMRALIDPRDTERLDRMSDSDWDATVKALIAADRRQELWELTSRAPAHCGVRILHELERQDWSPPDERDRAGFDELTRLARACSGDPASGLLGDEEPLVKQSGGMGVVSLAFSRDGRFLIGGTPMNLVCRWGLPPGNADDKAIVAHAFGKILDVMDLPDTDGFAVAGARATMLVDPAKAPNGEVLPDSSGAPALAMELALSADGRLLAGAGAEGALIWKPPWTAPAKTLRHEHFVHHVALSEAGGGCVALAGGSEGSIRLWQLQSDTTIALTGHEGPAYALVTSPDGRLLASGGRDGLIRLWRLPSGEAIGEIAAERSSVLHLAVTPDSRMLISAGGEGSVRLWHLPSGAPAGELTGHKGMVWRLAVTPDGALLAGGGDDPTIRLWHLPSGEPAGTLSGFKGITRVSRLVMSRDGTFLAAASNRATHVRIWRLWHAGLRAACRTPIGRLGPTQVARLSEEVSDDREQAWAAVIAALVNRLHRYDIDLADDDAARPPGATDIEATG